MAEVDAACPWQRHYDDTGTVFYYNEATEESEWDIPPGWEDHFANLDRSAGPDADGGASGADATAVQDGDVSAAAEEAEQEHAPAEDGRREAEERRQVDDTEGAEALLGLAQVAGGEQHRAEEDGTSPPQQQEDGGAVSSPSPIDQDEHQAGHGGERTASDDVPADAASTSDGGDYRANEGTTAEDAAVAPADAAAAGCPWIQSVDEESGNVFYYNEATEESSWDEPPEYTKFHAAASAAAATAAATTTTDAAAATAAINSDSEEEYYRQEEDGDGTSAGAADGHGYGGSTGRGTPSPAYSYDGQEDGGTARPPPSSSRSPSPRRSWDRPSSSGTAAASATRTHNNNAKSSPEMGLSFPAFGDDYSPANEDEEEDDWRVNEEDEAAGDTPPGSPGGSAGTGATAFDGPGSEGLRSGENGFAVGELSPTVDNGGSGGRNGGEGRQGGDGGDAGGKENSAVVGGDGKPPRYSEEEKKKMVEKADRELADCERRLEEKDAIMEVDFSARVTAYQSARERLELLKDGVLNRQNLLKETRNAGVRKLIAGYTGYAQQAALVNNWLNQATNGSESEQTEDLMLQQLKRLIKDNFDAKKVDTLLDSSMPAWLLTMQEDDGWRRTLIELAREHRQSAFLRFVLKQLSDNGYHREIAAVISETDLFSVFNGVLKDALARIPADDDVEATEALADLKRMCCSTSYMFMYSQQLLIDLERAAAEESRLAAAVSEGATKVNGNNNNSSGRKRGRETSSSAAAAGKGTDKESNGGDEGGAGWGRSAAARKYKRLRQELASHMYKVGGRADSNSSSPDAIRGGGGFSLGRTISGGIGGGGAGGRSGGIGGGAEDDGAASAGGAPTGGFLRGLEMGLSLGPSPTPRPPLHGSGRAAIEGAAVAEQFAGSEHARRPPASFLRHPTVMGILLEALFHPAHRCASEDLRAGCCALLSFASCVEVPTLDSDGAGGGGGGRETVDFAELAQTSHALMQAAGECFETSQLASLQGRLRLFAEHPIVSLGVLKWIHAQVSTEAFVSTPSFLSYAPVFLKLCGQVSDEHPPQRPETFEILKFMLKAQTAPDTPPATKTKLKQHVLLRMAELVVKGYLLPVLDYLRKLTAGPGLDQPLIGFFMVKIIGVAIPRPVARGGHATSYSPTFLNAMAGLMGVPRVRQAIIALKPVERERVVGYARYCLKFQRDDLTAEALEWMKQLQVGLERA
eukprot:g2299.t1